MNWSGTEEAAEWAPKEEPDPGVSEVAHSTLKVEESITTSKGSPVFSFLVKEIVVNPPDCLNEAKKNE